MEKDNDQKSYQMTEQEYLHITAKLNNNKQEMLRILQENPKIGAYINETHAQWDIFYDFFMKFLKSEIGPRGECAKLIRAQLLQKQEQVNEVLLPFGQTAKTHIRQIYMKHKFFVPCEEYTQLIKLEEINARNKQNLSRLKDENSLMVKAITNGLLAKHGNEFNIGQQIQKLQNGYIAKIIDAEKEIARLKEILDATPVYHQYMKVKHFFQPFFKQWIQVDSSIGKQNIKTGQGFEQKVKDTMIPYLIYRQKQHKNWIYGDKKIQVFINCNWIPKNLGQIDIAFGYKDEVEDRYFITTLIECKSRLFDLREAYKQVSLDDQQPLNKGPTLQQLKENKRLKLLKSKSKTQKKVQKTQQATNQALPILQNEQLQVKKQSKFVVNKKFISTKYGPAQLVKDHHFYIITTLPQNDFLLPIESKMKQSIEKHNKNLFVQQIQSESLYLSLVDRFSKVMSPLDWFKKYQQAFQKDQSNILVLN